MQIQQNGHSQVEMLKVFNESLQRQCGPPIKCNKSAYYIYIDDVLFSGSRIGNDLTAWITNTAPESATVDVIVVAVHAFGEFKLMERLREVIASAGKKIKIRYWSAVTIENRRYYKNNSEVLWPVAIPDDPDVQEYSARPQKFPFVPRTPGGSLGPFTSERGRQLLERELLIAGVRIRNLSQNPKEILRPLGFSPFGLGFGSMIVTFRNCPNNCPLALWWGDPKATTGPFHWYPLLPRRTYEQ
jgi:hypothetical protein